MLKYDNTYCQNIYEVYKLRNNNNRCGKELKNKQFHNNCLIQQKHQHLNFVIASLVGHDIEHNL